MFAIGVAGGLLISTASIARVAPWALKEPLRNDPDRPKKFSAFTEIKPGRAKLIMREGKILHTLISGEGIEPELYINDDDPEWWNNYKRWVWENYNLQALIPLVETVHSYDLPRYVVVDRDGKEAFDNVEAGDPGFRSDHVRIDPFTWDVQFKGVEIESLAFTVKAAAQVRIRPDMVDKALFQIESWNIFLTRVINSQARAIVRSRATIDMVVGTVKNYKDIFLAAPVRDRDYGQIQQAILQGLRAYSFEVTNPDGSKTTKTLMDFGIDLLAFDIIDFDPELEDEEKRRLSAAAIKLREARARILEGKGEAGAKKAVAEALKDFPDFAQAQLETDAFVKAAEAGTVEAFFGALIKNYMKGKS